MMDAVFNGLLAGYGLAVPVGAVAVLMVNLTARTSFATGAAAAAGAVTADAVYAVAVSIVGGVLAAVIQPWSSLLRVASALVLVAMAAHIVRGAVRNRANETEAVTPPTGVRTYFAYLGLTALNPWPAVYFTALMLGRSGEPVMNVPNAVAYVAGIIVASASWQFLLAGGGAVLGRALTSRRGRLITSIASGALITALAIHMLLPV